jgi:hypothetical protein
MSDSGISDVKDMKMIRSWTDPIDETTEEISRTHLRTFPRKLRLNPLMVPITSHKYADLVIAGINPKSPRHFTWQPSARVSQALRVSYPSHMISAPTYLHRWLQEHADLPCAYEFAHSPDLWRHPRLANVTCAWSWRLCGITPAIHTTSLASTTYSNAWGGGGGGWW